jgi:hypothetical protein
MINEQPDLIISGVNYVTLSQSYITLARRQNFNFVKVNHYPC